MRQDEKVSQAVRIARMYYYQNMTTAAIARENHVSRSTVSRMLSFAKESGLVEIKILDPTEEPNLLANIIRENFDVQKVHVIAVSETAGELEWLNRTAVYTASYLNTLFESNMILGIAWGTTQTAISKNLLKKTTRNSQIVQLNGAGNTHSMGIEYASQIVMHYSNNFDARAQLFPVPTLFDYKETKRALWKEASIKRILALQSQADLLLYSIGAVKSGIPSHVYSGGYLTKKDYLELEKYKIAGDIATVFFKNDGSFDRIPINDRASGPNLQLFKDKHGICVVSGLGKVNGLHAALKGGLMKELIVDEPTARLLVQEYLMEMT